MRKINRNNEPKPLDLDFGARSKANEELCENIKRLADNPDKPGLKFSVYKNDLVNQAVKNLTGKRCAYCENYPTRSSLDVEHYRPKGMLVLDDMTYLKPGYYWLAADWDNLLPSCQYCNRRKKLNVIEDGQIVQKKIGKWNYFPINNEFRARALNPYQECDEERLLLNPCIDDPDEFFEYRPVEINGACYIVIQARDGLALTQQRMANTTIDLLGLNDLNLAELRHLYADRCAELGNALNDALAGNRELLTSDIQDLLQFVLSDKQTPFIGMLRRLSKKLLFNLHNKLIEEQEINAEAITDNSLDGVILSLHEYSKNSERNRVLPTVF